MSKGQTILNILTYIVQMYLEHDFYIKVQNLTYIHCMGIGDIIIYTTG